MSKTSDPKAIRENLSRIGKTPGDVARELGVDRATVDGVLSGRLQGKRGDAHKVAVALGIKDGIIVTEDMSIADAMKLAAAR